MKHIDIVAKSENRRSMSSFRIGMCWVAILLALAASRSGLAREHTLGPKEVTTYYLQIPADFSTEKHVSTTDPGVRVGDFDLPQFSDEVFGNRVPQPDLTQRTVRRIFLGHTRTFVRTNHGTWAIVRGGSETISIAPSEMILADRTSPARIEAGQIFRLEPNKPPMIVIETLGPTQIKVARLEIPHIAITSDGNNVRVRIKEPGGNLPTEPTGTLSYHPTGNPMSYHPTLTRAVPPEWREGTAAPDMLYSGSHPIERTYETSPESAFRVRLSVHERDRESAPGTPRTFQRVMLVRLNGNGVITARGSVDLPGPVH